MCDPLNKIEGLRFDSPSLPGLQVALADSSARRSQVRTTLPPFSAAVLASLSCCPALQAWMVALASISSYTAFSDFRREKGGESGGQKKFGTLSTGNGIKGEN